MNKRNSLYKQRDQTLSVGILTQLKQYNASVYIQKGYGSQWNV